MNARNTPTGIALCAMAALLSALATSSPEAAEARYPSRPVRMVVPFPPGASPNDITARLVAPRLAERLGEQVIVDNRPGAAGMIGAEIVAKSNPDGHTLLIHSSTLTVAPNAYKNLGFDPVKDLLPITMIAAAPQVLFVHASVPVNNLKELIAYVKSQPGQFKYSSGGNGSVPHLGAELLNHMAGLQMVHIPYKGGAPATSALLSGEVAAYIGTTAGSQGLIAGGKVKVMAITSRARSPQLPDIPTMEEAGVPGYEVIVWYGLFAPARTSPAIAERLYQDMRTVLANPDVRSRFTAMGAETADLAPAAFAKRYVADLARWAKFVRDTGLKLD